MANPSLHWWPSNADFAAEAARRAPAFGVRDFRELLEVIRQHKNLSRVYWYGHGARAELQFGSGQKLTEGGLAMLSNADVSKSFAPNGELVLVACNAGQSDVFLQAIANALHVRVRGYATGVQWSVEYKGSAPHRVISRRGLKSAAAVFSSGRVFVPVVSAPKQK